MNLRLFGASIVSFFSRKPVRLLWLVLPLMAMDSPGCVMSERPLTRFQDDSIDTSLFGDQSFVNLQFVDAGCLDCTDEEFAANRARFQQDYASVVPDNPRNFCTYMFVRYELSGDGRLTYYAMDPELVVRAFEADALKGYYEEGTGPDEYDGPCITASMRRLRNYVRDEGAEVFNKEEWTMVRRPLQLAD